MKSNSQIIQQAFPKNMETISLSMLENLKEEAFKISDYENSYFLEGEKLVLPYRVYCEPHLLAYYIGQYEELRLVAFCLLTRHYNGYVREKYLKEIIGSNEIWVIPFIVQLLGEYVVEIIQIIYCRFDEVNKKNLIVFIKENPQFWELTKSRVISYWNCYYRWRGIKGDYVGFKVIKRIEHLIKESNENTDNK